MPTIWSGCYCILAELLISLQSQVPPVYDDLSHVIFPHCLEAQLYGSLSTRGKQKQETGIKTVMWYIKKRFPNHNIQEVKLEALYNYVWKLYSNVTTNDSEKVHQEKYRSKTPPPTLFRQTGRDVKCDNEDDQGTGS